MTSDELQRLYKLAVKAEAGDKSEMLAFAHAVLDISEKYASMPQQRKVTFRQIISELKAMKERGGSVIH